MVAGVAACVEARAASSAPDPFPFLPAGATGLAYAHPEHVGPVPWKQDIVTESGAKGPCYRKIAQLVDATFQVMFGPRQTVSVLRGKLKRDATEACIGEYIAMLGKKSSFVRKGNVTIVTFADAQTHLGWRNDGYVVVHESRPLVESFLTKPAGLAGNPGLAALLARVDRSRSLWMAAELDVASGLLGIPSKGFWWAFTPEPAVKRFPISVVFETPAKAAEAERAVVAKAKDEAMRDFVRDALAAAAARARDDQLDLDLMPFLSSPRAGEALEAMINPTQLAELRAIMAQADERLARMSARASNLPHYRDEVARLEAELQSALAAIENPAQRAAIEATRADAGVQADAETTPTPLPPVDPNESSEAGRLRERIVEARRRAAKFEEAASGVDDLIARKRELEARLALIKKLRAGQ